MASFPELCGAFLREEILRIRERYLATTGHAGTAALRAFHDALAGSGALPLRLAERALLGTA